MHASLLQALSVGLGTSWTAGINLYASVAVLGALHRWGGLELPGELDALGNGWVITIAAVMYTVEFFADKIPYLDSTWDLVQTFVRVPAGAAIAALSFGDYSPAAQIIALLGGGTLALSSHTTKAATRAAINASPEPFTNIAASIAEDLFAVGYVLLAYFLPIVALFVLLLAVIAMGMLLPLVGRFLGKGYAALLRRRALREMQREER